MIEFINSIDFRSFGVCAKILRPFFHYPYFYNHNHKFLTLKSINLIELNNFSMKRKHKFLFFFKSNSLIDLKLIPLLHLILIKLYSLLKHYGILSVCPIYVIFEKKTFYHQGNNHESCDNKL